jgi:hypothetical protein
MGGSVFTQTISFTPDGRFERTNGALHGTGAVQSAGGFSGSAASVEDRNGRRSSSSGSYNSAGNGSSVVATSSSRRAGNGSTSGTYSVTACTLELRSQDGTIQRVLAFYAFPDEAKGDVFIDDATYNIEQ